MVWTAGRSGTDLIIGSPPGGDVTIIEPSLNTHAAVSLPLSKAIISQLCQWRCSVVTNIWRNALSGGCHTGATYLCVEMFKCHMGIMVFTFQVEGTILEKCIKSQCVCWSSGSGPGKRVAVDFSWNCWHLVFWDDIQELWIGLVSCQRNAPCSTSRILFLDWSSALKQYWNHLIQ